MLWSLNSSGITDIQDPHSQHLIETHSQTFFIALTVSPIHHHDLAQCTDSQAISFLLSYFTKSVLLGLEAFAAGFAVLLLVGSFVPASNEEYV